MNCVLRVVCDTATGSRGGKKYKVVYYINIRVVISIFVAAMYC